MVTEKVKKAPRRKIKRVKSASTSLLRSGAVFNRYIENTFENFVSKYEKVFKDEMKTGKKFKAMKSRPQS